MIKAIWFRTDAKDGRAIPVYFRKGYKKARVKRWNERRAPGFWKAFVKGGFYEGGGQG